MSRQEEGELCRTGARNPQGGRAPEAKMTAGARDRYCSDRWARTRKGLAFPSRGYNLVLFFFFV